MINCKFYSYIVDDVIELTLKSFLIYSIFLYTLSRLGKDENSSNKFLDKDS